MKVSIFQVKVHKVIVKLPCEKVEIVYISFSKVEGCSLDIIDTFSCPSLKRVKFLIFVFFNTYSEAWKEHIVVGGAEAEEFKKFL